MFGHSEQASPISEGVIEIWINSHLARENNLTTRHTWATQAPRAATFRDDYQRVEPGPPYSSAVLHTKTSTGRPWVAWTLSQCHPWSTLGCHPTQRSSKLLSLQGHINLICSSTQLNACCSRVQPTRSLIDTGGGYHLRSSEYEIRPLSTFPSGIPHFPLVVPPDLK
jgi:hypothetical protein